jgi:regulatory protein
MLLTNSDDIQGSRVRPVMTCYNKALDALARASRSRADLDRWLRQRDYSVEEVQSALSKLESAGLLNDLAFARGFARTRLETRGFGPRRVTTELMRRGVSREIISQVLEELRLDAEAKVPEGEEPVRAIDAVAARRWRSLSKLEPAVARRRLQGFLARRGFESNEIIRVLRALR